ncbi:MAG TPA: biosynthetic arginine decarboxylase [Thioploca sp.]|nr:biosynthetic arginine decarboxylase [Thioploca sp.]
MPNWNFIDSQKLYNIKHWSEGYFDIDQNGEVIATSTSDQNNISLYKLTQELKNQGISLPILVRFPNILHHRVNSLYNAFITAMQQENYKANYTAVYPIKVNQQHQVIETILNTGKTGLESGSKSELIGILALAPKNNIVICNGYKDREYIRLALIGQQIGIKIYLVIEKTSELQLIIKEVKKLNVIPRLGIRIKLASIAKGKWQDSGGAKSKFGLNSTQILDIINLIDEAGLIDSLQLMHFHIGSQIPNIRDIQKGLYEAGRYYAELKALGVPINTIDVGGGLGIDYEGMRSRRPCSINYDIQEYANNVIHEFKEICNTFNLPQPNIITETGRAITAHHAVLITNIVDTETISNTIQPASTDDPEIIQDLWQQLNSITKHSALEVYHNAVYWLNEVHTLFSYGVIDLKQRAHAEQLYYAICKQVQILLRDTSNSRIYREVYDELNEKLADKYFANFSLFQSVPDAWAIDQLFPILPLHRLNEYPNRKATLQDLTCDSDGQFKHYVSNNGIDTNLPVHTITSNEEYLLGIFLIGAYQEILGDMHNLFGDTHSVNIQIMANGDYKLIAPIKGDTVKTTLDYVNFDTDNLLNIYNEKLYKTNLNIEQKQLYLQELQASLENYTYLKI